MPRLEARGVELAWSESGDGAPMLLVHETATRGDVWSTLVDALGGRARSVRFDRRGWGASSSPPGYRRTTVEEQAEDAAAVLAEAAATPATLVGAGLGAVVCLDLLLRRPEIVAGAVLVEPTLLGLVAAATEAISDDGRAIEAAVAEGGAPAVARLLREGALTALGAGAERLPADLFEDRPGSIFAELGVSSEWRMPLSRLARAERPAAIVACGSTPELLGAACEALSDRLGAGGVHQLDSGAAPPQIGGAEELARLALELAGRG